MRLVKKKRKLTKLTKRFLGYTFITLILILGCLLSYPKLEIKDNEITIDINDDFFYDNYKATLFGKDITNKVVVSNNIKWSI